MTYEVAICIAVAAIALALAFHMGREYQRTQSWYKQQNFHYLGKARPSKVRNRGRLFFLPQANKSTA